MNATREVRRHPRRKGAAERVAAWRRMKVRRRWAWLREALGKKDRAG